MVYLICAVVLFACMGIALYRLGEDLEEIRRLNRLEDCLQHEKENLEASLKELRDKKEQLKLEEYETTRQ